MKCRWTLATKFTFHYLGGHLFFAERHVISSDFSIETTIADPGSCR